ncbi:MAG TPA: hypothetical protein EYP99_00865, partial [Candidatus Poseidoniales archaeon]|nr:hypothetical protein [Candidatus Poseidoniales archaeon]
MTRGRGSRIALLVALILLIAIPVDTFANSSGKTGSSSTGCTCHYNTVSVIPTLSGLPSVGYIGDTTYNLSIGGSGGPSGTKGGFNLATTQGSFSDPGSNVQLSSGEVTHSNSNSRSWMVNWTSPSNGSGNVTFNLAVNFVNGNGLNTGDGWGTASWTISEADSDSDGWTDADEEACGTNPNDSGDVPSDTDGDGTCNGVDDDDDGDGWSDSDETDCATDSNNSTSTPVDTDNDGICNYLDGDDDGDGTPDDEDDFPLDPEEDTDTDDDGVGDNADTDDDNDGWNDTAEADCGTNSTDPNSVPLDTDG